MTDKMDKCTKDCLIKQELVLASGDYLKKSCIECEQDFYVSKHSHSKHCCLCRKQLRNEKKRIARINSISPIEGFPREQFQNRKDMLEYLKGDGLSKIQCLLCGHWYGRLGVHIPKAHDMEIKEYKIKFGIPFRGYGLIGQKLREHCSALGKEQAAKQTPKIRKELQEKMMVAMKEGGIRKNLTPYYHEELKKQSVIASAKMQEFVRGKRAIAPCSRCGKETEVSLMASISAACILYCDECRKLARKEKAKKCYEGGKKDPIRWNHYLERMREYRRNKKATIGQNK